MSRQSCKPEVEQSQKLGSGGLALLVDDRQRQAQISRREAEVVEVMTDAGGSGGQCERLTGVEQGVDSKRLTARGCVCSPLILCNILHHYERQLEFRSTRPQHPPPLKYLLKREPCSSACTPTVSISSACTITVT